MQKANRKTNLFLAWQLHAIGTLVSDEKSLEDNTLYTEASAEDDDYSDHKISRVKRRVKRKTLLFKLPTSRVIRLVMFADQGLVDW